MQRSRRSSGPRALAVALAVAAAGVLIAVSTPRAVLAQGDSATTLDRIVAVVNERVVLQSDLERELAAVRASIRQRNLDAPSGERLRRQVLDRLIMQRLQLDAADDIGITVDDATIDAAVRRVARRNEMTLPEFRDALETEEGLTMSDYRERLRRQITISRVRQQAMQQRVQVTSQEVEQFMAQNAGEDSEYRLGHILISVPSGADEATIDDARQEALAVRRQLDAEGASFERLAVAHSDGRSALDGGDVGWRNRGEMPAVLAERIDSLAPGDISEVLRNASGFHIFRIADKRQSDRRIVTQTHARHILIQTDQVTSDAVARQELEALRRRIIGGESFADLARANSDDSGSASNGGDLGWRTPGELVPAFQRELDSLPPGTVSEPFRTPYGWHIAEVLERRQRDTTEQYRRRQATDSIRQRKEDEELEAWLRQLREEAYIDYRAPFSA